MNIVNDTMNTTPVIQNQIGEEKNESLGSRIGTAVKKFFKAIGKFFATPFVAIKNWFESRKVAKVNNNEEVSEKKKDSSTQNKPMNTPGRARFSDYIDERTF